MDPNYSTANHYNPNRQRGSAAPPLMVVPPLLLPSQHSQPFLTMDAPLDRARLFTRVTLWQPSLNVGLILAIIQVGSMVSDLARLDVHSQCKSLRRCGSRGEATEGLTRCLDLKQKVKIHTIGLLAHPLLRGTLRSRTVI